MLGSGKYTSKTCPPEPSSVATGDAVAGSLTFKHLITIIGWICTAITILLCLGLIIPHLRRFKVPNEQRQIIRILWTPVVFTVFGVISIHVYAAGPYLTPFANLYEAFALASLFLLFVNYVTPDSNTRFEYFHSLENKKHGKVAPGGSLRWFQRTWRTIFLYTVVYSILVLVTVITLAVGTYCATSDSVHFAHIWVQVLELVSVIMAVGALLRFYRRVKPDMVVHHPLGKLLSFKAIVFVGTIQNFVFSMLRSKVTGGSKVTYNDLTIGLPACLICIEQVIFSAFFYFTFRSSEYRTVKEQQGSPLEYGMGRAIAEALNPSDLLGGIAAAFGHFGRKSQQQHLETR